MIKGCIFHDTTVALHDRRLFEIVEEAYGRREKTLIFAGSEERAAEIDRFLWILRQDSFIPHQVFHSREEDVSVLVAIVAAEWNPLRAGILIADGRCSMKFASGFSLVHEFVDRTSRETHAACRDRYRAYQDKKIHVEYLKTGVWKGAVPKK